MFNDDQRDYMASLARRPHDTKCYCGWYSIGKCPHCPKDLTHQDAVDRACPECRSYPPHYDLTQEVHIISCSRRAK